MGVLSCCRSSSIVMKVAVCLSVIVAVCSAESWLAGPYTLVKRAAEPQRTRFFTGNNAIDAGAAGAALGVGAQYFANQIFNPCTRGGNRNNNKGTNNRIFGGQTLQNGALGFLLVLQAQPLLIMPKEILVEDNDILDYTKRLTH